MRNGEFGGEGWRTNKEMLTPARKLKWYGISPFKKRGEDPKSSFFIEVELWKCYPRGSCCAEFHIGYNSVCEFTKIPSWILQQA